MKKEYIKPSIELEKIELEDVIAVSNAGEKDISDAGSGNVFDIFS